MAEVATILWSDVGVALIPASYGGAVAPAARPSAALQHRNLMQGLHGVSVRGARMVGELTVRRLVAGVDLEEAGCCRAAREQSSVAAEW